MYQTQLETTQLGQTGLQITRVGFGAWAIGGGDWEFGWGHQDDQEGVTQRPYVFTGCSLLPGPDREVLHSLTRDSILREAGDSLKRLGLDAIDLYQIHWPIPTADIDLVDRLTAVAERHDTTPGAIAVAWTLRNPAVDAAIVGFRRPDQVDPILPGASLELSDEDLAEIERSAQ